MKNITVKSNKKMGPMILRYEEGDYLCPSGHVVEKSGNDFICRKCNEVFKKI